MIGFRVEGNWVMPMVSLSRVWAGAADVIPSATAMVMINAISNREKMVWLTLAVIPELIQGRSQRCGRTANRKEIGSKKLNDRQSANGEILEHRPLLWPDIRLGVKENRARRCEKSKVSPPSSQRNIQHIGLEGGPLGQPVVPGFEISHGRAVLDQRHPAIHRNGDRDVAYGKRVTS